jgi:hypothetical protein
MLQGWPKTLDLCPLCEKMFTWDQLEVRIKEDRPSTREQIIKAIKGDYPAWVPEDGACQHCWESFRGVVRVLRFIETFKFPKRWRRPQWIADDKRAADRSVAYRPMNANTVA